MFTIIGGDGKEYGPASVEQVREWLATGRANLDSQAKQSGYEQWKRLGDFDEFAPPETSLPPVLADLSAPSTLVPAHRGMRLLAAFIDWVLYFLCTLPTLRVVWPAVLNQAMRGQVDPQAIMDLTGENIGRSLPFLCTLLVVQTFLLVRRGQSIGKVPTGLRIVRFSTEAAAGFTHVFLIRSAVPYLIGQIPVLSTLFWLVDTCFIFRDDRRCLHDLMADTKVVKK